jgi:integrase
MSVKWNDRRSRWQAWWRDEHGKPHSKDFLRRQGDDGADAFERLVRAEVDKRRKKVRHTAASLGAHVEAWLSRARLRVAEQTLVGYRSTLAAFLEPLYVLQLHEVTRTKLEERLGELNQPGEGGRSKRKKTTLRRYVVTARLLFSEAARGGFIAADPTEGLVKALGKHQRSATVRSLSFDNFSSLLYSFRGHRFEWAVGLMGLAGLREGEALALRRDDVDFERKQIHVERTAIRYGSGIGPVKGRRAAFVPMAPQLADILERELSHWPERQEWFMPEMAKASPREVGRLLALLYRTIRDKGKRLGFRATPHMLRHSLGASLIARGASPVLVRDQLRHADIGTTVQTYAVGARVEPVALDALAKDLLPHPGGDYSHDPETVKHRERQAQEREAEDERRQARGE